MNTLFLLGLAMFLGACGTTTGTTQKHTGAYSNAYANLPSLERAYKNNTDNMSSALKYATALRKADYLNRASTVIAPFANDDNGPIEAKLEYAAIQIALENYNSAQDYAEAALTQDKKNAAAHHYLGITLDAKEEHQEAETAYNNALQYGNEKSVTILNDLALNLMSQGKLEAATETLEMALGYAPGNTDLQRNLRIATTLLEGSPKKKKKDTLPLPKAKPKR